MWWRRSATCSRRPKPRKRSNAFPLLPVCLRGRLMRVYGSSMAPTLQPGQLVFVNAYAYAIRAPHRGEVVAATPLALNGKALVKRLVGLPRDQVEIGGHRWQLGPDQFFLLGDQPDESMDSRQFGPVSREELVGPIRCRVWPWQLMVPSSA